MIKDIAVHLDGSPADDRRIAYATHLAQTFSAHLTGLVENALFEVSQAFGSAAAAGIPDSILDEMETRTAGLVDALGTKLSAAGIPSEVRRVDAYSGAMPGAFARQVRTSDLFVGTLTYERSATGSRIEEGVLFGSGRPCFFVPRGDPRERYDRVLVAWKDTREAARAVAEALPFLRAAKEVTVAIVEEYGAAERLGEEISADIGRYLSRHGIRAEMRMINGWEDVPAALANEAKAVAADLIVMGGYGHSRVRELILGGATRGLLNSAAIPILMAH